MEKLNNKIIELLLDGAYNANRWVYNSVKCESNVIVLPAENKNEEKGNTYFQSSYQYNGYIFNDNSLCILVDKYHEAYEVLNKYNQNICLFKDNIDKRLYIIERY